MRTPDAIRIRRMRRRLGLRMVQVEISEEIIELLEKRGYNALLIAPITCAIRALFSFSSCAGGRPY